LPGWDGGKWNTKEPWRFFIDLAYDIPLFGDQFGNWFEKELRTRFEIGIEQ
jgi:hypothetical protein